MLDKIRISVIIPNYNRAHLLVKAIKSALDQQCPPEEILVCDDGSTDQSKSEVLKMKDPRVKWMDTGRHGRPAIPRNAGVRASKGNWLAFLDNDDEWLPDKLSKQVAVLEKHNAAVAVCTNANKITDGKFSPYFENHSERKLTFESLVVSNEIICSSVLANKDVIIKCGGFPETPALRALEDYALWLRMSCFGDIYFAGKPFVNYLDDSNSGIRKDSPTVMQQRAILFRDFKKWRKKNPGACSAERFDLMTETFVTQYMSPSRKLVFKTTGL